MQFEEQNFLTTKLYKNTARGVKKLKRQKNALNLEVIFVVVSNEVTLYTYGHE
ncbi:MAG: hypothetical protein QG579_418 [Patescibacteria group bacterium]|jgi:hypothetical protein|nr:hypothetical protein [Patescibacteria group bacterium]